MAHIAQPYLYKPPTHPLTQEHTTLLQLLLLLAACNVPLLDVQGPFSAVVDQHVTDPWLRNMLDLECFVLSGMLAKDTLTAEMAFMFMERGQGKGRIDYPVSASSQVKSSHLL